MRVDDFHWLTGILEGEGTFLAGPPSDPRSPAIRLSMTDRDVVERVGRLFERAVIELRPRRADHKIPFVTTVKGTPAVELMRAMRPLFGAARRAQIDRAIASWHGRPARWRSPRAGCVVASCGRPGARRGLCVRHYDQWWKATRAGRATSLAPVAAPGYGDGLPSIDADMSAEAALAWLAGLLEGEGSFTSQDGYPIVLVSMCSKDVIVRVAGLVRPRTIREIPPPRANWNVAYQVRISGHAAAALMRRLRPLMGRRRGAAIDAALAAYRPIRLSEAPEHCVVPGCARPHRSRGLCHAHYMRWSRYRAAGKDSGITPLR